MIMIHSSAVLTLLLRDPGFEAVAAKLCEVPEVMISPIVVMNVLLKLSKRYADPAPILGTFLRQSGIGQRAVDSIQTSWARQGFLTYSAGRWSLADCFAYGAAKALDAPLLATTDIFATCDLRML
jgi:ribonuclease VapC